MHAGVTAITVSRYLREPQRVAEDTAQRIRSALVATGYLPNKQAGLLASGVSNIVAALLPNLANSIFGETAQGLSDTLQAQGYELLITSTGYAAEREAEQLRAVLGWRPAGVVVTGHHHTPEVLALLAHAQRAGTAVVQVWDVREPPSLPSGGVAETTPTGAAQTRQQPLAEVGFSHAAIGRAMADHLLALGHRHLAHVDSGVAGDHRAHARAQAFAARGRAAGAQVTLLVAQPGDPFDAGRALLPLLLQPTQAAQVHPLRQEPQPPQPTSPNPSDPITAVACANDHLASGILLEARRQRVPMPQRLAVLGFGDFAWARQLDPPLSSVALPRYDIGVQAAQVLLARYRGQAVASTMELPWQVLARASTLGVATVQDPRATDHLLDARPRSAPTPSSATIPLTHPELNTP